MKQHSVPKTKHKSMLCSPACFTEIIPNTFCFVEPSFITPKLFVADMASEVKMKMMNMYRAQRQSFLASSRSTLE